MSAGRMGKCRLGLAAILGVIASAGFVTALNASPGDDDLKLPKLELRDIETR